MGSLIIPSDNGVGLHTPDTHYWRVCNCADSHVNSLIYQQFFLEVCLLRLLLVACGLTVQSQFVMVWEWTPKLWNPPFYYCSVLWMKLCVLFFSALGLQHAARIWPLVYPAETLGWSKLTIIWWVMAIEMITTDCTGAGVTGVSPGCFGICFVPLYFVTAFWREYSYIGCLWRIKFLTFMKLYTMEPSPYHAMEYMLVPFPHVWPISIKTFHIHVPIQMSLHFFYCTCKTTSSGNSFPIRTTHCVKMLPLDVLLNLSL